MAEEKDGKTTFSPTNSSKDHLNAEQISQNNFWTWQRTPGTQKGSTFSSKGGHLYLLHPPSLLYPNLWISLGVLGCGEHVGNWLLARSVSLLLPSPLLLLVTSISFLPLLFSSLLCVTLWTSLSVPDYGEHIGNWFLARLLAPLLIPPLLLLVTSISLLPLLFSM